jgi:lipopolysaccharide export system permease protein
MNLLSRKPVLLYSYLATEMLAPFFAAFVVMNAVFFLVKLIPFLNFALELSIGLGDFIRLFCYMFPNMFLYTIPMASMMGVIVGFSRLSNDTEILAIKASGISLYHVIPPVFIISACIAIFTGYFSIKLIPVSEIAMKQLTYQLLKEKVDKGIKEYQFTEALGDLVVHVGKIDEETGIWKKVWVSDMRGQVNPTITMAATGSMKSDLDRMMVTIVLHDGSLHRPEDKDAQIVQFGKYTINIPLRPPDTGVNSVHRGTLTMDQLLVAADKFGIDNKRGRVMLIEYHERLVLPFGCLILSILGLPLGLQAGPGRKAIGVPFGLAVFILFYVLFTMGKMIAKEGSHDQLGIAALLWMPDIFFLIVTVYCVQRVFSEKSLVPSWMQFLYTTFHDLIIAPLLTVFNKWFQFIMTFLPTRKKVDTIPEIKQSSKVRANVSLFQFHLEQCSEYRSDQCTIEFSNADVAIDAGYTPCDYCKKLLDQASSTEQLQ